MTDYSLTIGGESEFVLLASGLGDDTGGGLFAYDGRAVEQVDRVSTTGLYVAGDRLIRTLWCSSDIGVVGELLIYDRCGIERYYRIDALSDPHDVLWDGEHFVLVSSSTNSILWISPSGEVARRWQAPGEGDVWHLNSLLLKDDELLVSAFGRFSHHREWSGIKKDRAGFVLNLTTGEDVITGLSCPHHPRYVDDAWIVCNSATGELLQIDPGTQEVSRRLQLRAWPRGLAFSETAIFVGESANRQAAGTDASASIAVVSRQDWTVLDRLILPCREVYDLVLARRSLLEGVRRAFRTNPLRVAESDQHTLFSQLGVQPARLWAIGDPLPKESCRVRVEADVPDALDADSLIDLPCTVENMGSAFLK